MGCWMEVGQMRGIGERARRDDGTAYDSVLSWSKVTDGSHGAEGYQIRTYKQGIPHTNVELRSDDETGGWDCLGTSNWTAASAFDGKRMTRELHLELLNRYFAQVRAISPHFRPD